MVISKRSLLLTILVLTITMTADARKKPWGPEYSTPENDAQVRTIINAMAIGPEEAKEHFSDSVIVGPALVARLIKADPSLAAIGKPMTLVNPGSSAAREMRLYSTEEISKLLSSTALIDLAKQCARGNVRAASNREREAYYYTIPFECEKSPMAVADSGKDSLFISISDGKALWLDCLSDY